MVDHRELVADVTATLSRAGLDAAGPSPLRIGPGPAGVVVGWPPGGGSPEGVRTAVLGAVAVVLREAGHEVTEVDGGDLHVAPVPEPGGVPAEPETVPEQWWG
ncbi:hypothetical protein PUR71_13145 [Streptomyces sp. SP17BM10]|uniref:hypothetical protein n=1 Tax=Streptomyces sp. SP17BM10 TaxID=3002530 RepID=UPI002E763A74|nr:hypothetical protein [Streptomyces sp. SP17BM10]MEE1783846.1 hypothetical protein [Streptomyces sp. SP17BM10]